MTQPISGPLTLEQVAAASMLASEYQFDDQFVPAENPLATLIPYHTWVTSALSGGTYQFSVTAFAGGVGVSQNTEMEVAFQFTGGPLVQGPLFSFSITSGRFGFGPSFAVLLPPGPATVNLLFGHPTSPGTARMISNQFQIERKA